jgi:hypothetical protein
LINIAIGLLIALIADAKLTGFSGAQHLKNPCLAIVNKLHFYISKK